MSDIEVERQPDEELMKLVSSPPSHDGGKELPPAVSLPGAAAQPPPPITAPSNIGPKIALAKQGWMWQDDDVSKSRLRALFVMIDRFEVDVDGGDDQALADTPSAPQLTNDRAVKYMPEAKRGSGGISSTELMHMLINLGEDVPEGMADEMVDLIDMDKSSQIEFKEFYGVLTGSVSLNGKWRNGETAEHTVGGGGQSIREIRQMFDTIDEDGGGSLDKDEVAALAEKMGQGFKKRHLLDAMRAMDPSDTGEVGFDAFKNWLVDTKEGRHWSDFLVLPEGAVAVVRQRAAAENLLPVQGTPEAEWQRLSVLLKLLWDTVDVWGSPVSLYGLDLGKTQEAQEETDVLTAEDIELEAIARSWFFHPNLPTRTAWDLVQVVLLLYLLVVVPLRIAFGLEVEFGSPTFWFDAAVDVYFIVDIFMNFRTGYYDTRGVLVIKYSTIAKNYLKTWFVLDVVTCLPVSYVMMIIKNNTESAGAGKEVRAFKILRLLKLGKLLRVARIIRIINRYQEELRKFMAAFGSIILSCVVFLFCHLIACMWFYTGSFNTPEDSVHGTPALDGWVMNYWGPSCEDQAAAAAAPAPAPAPAPDSNADMNCVEADQNTRYITSAYWSMMTISTVGYGDIPVSTDGEKILAMLTMLFGSLIFAAITGSLSARFMAGMGAKQDFNTRMDEVRQYVRDHSVPTRQRRAVEAHFQLLWGKAAIYDEKEILALLPRVLRDPIVHTQYTPILSHCALFAKLGSIPQGHEVTALVAQQLTHTVAKDGMVVMRQGEYGSDLFFIADGEVDVYRTQGSTTPADKMTYGSDPRANLGMRLGRLGVDSYFGEQAVMTRGNGLRRGVRTRSVVSRNQCQFHVLSKASLDALREEIPILNGVVATVEEYGYTSHAQLVDSPADGQLAGEVRALSTKVDKALAAIAALNQRLS